MGNATDVSGVVRACVQRAASLLSEAAAADRPRAAVAELFGGAADSGGGGQSAKESASAESLSMGVLFTTMLIFLGGTFFMTHRDRIPLPYTVVLFLYGIVVGAIAKLVAPGVASTLGEIPPELLFYIFLPVLIFEGSFAMNVHALRRVFWQTLILASVGILLNTAILGCVVKLVYTQWSWYTALLLGSLLSATDPVAVVALLKSLRVESHITAMVDGEAVINDGTAIIVFTLLLPAAKYGEMTDSVGRVVLNSIRLSLLPAIIGPTFGFLQSFWLRRAKDGLTRACVTVSVTYVSYYIAAQWVGASGVLTLFFQGVFLSYYCPSLFPGLEGGNLISSTWEFLVHMGNTMLFSLVGVILVADVVPTIEAVDLFVIVGLYIAMVLARLVMLEVLLPVMNLFPFKLTQRTLLLLTHAGLRGGVAATLALAVQQSGLKEGIPILKVTCGVVLLTLLINATTAARVVSRLGFKSKVEYRVQQVQHAMDSLYHAEEKALERMKRDTKYRNANWQSVERYVNRWLRNPFRGMEIQPDVSHDVMINRLLMTAFKAALWRQRDEQVISETVVMQLGQVLSDKIEKGELFNISEMALYHGASEVVVTDPVASPSVAVTSPIPVHREVTSTDSGGRDRLGAASPTRKRSPRTLSIVIDSHYENRGGVDDGGRGMREEEELPMVLLSEDAGAAVPSRVSPGTSITCRSPCDGAFSAGSPVTVRSPVDGPHALLFSTGGEGGTAAEEDADVVVEALMDRLLPTWTVLAERVFGKGFFVSAHRRAQENAFMSLLAVVKCLSVISPMKYQYVKTPEQARRVEDWFSQQLQDGNAAIRFFYNHFPEATNTVSSTRAVISVVNALQEAVESLHTESGIGVRVKELLEGMIDDVREHVPARWENDVPTKESDLVIQAVAATTLGKGLRKAEIKAIAAMALMKNFSEYDVITLPENAFLIVVFGSLRALHSRWTTISQHEWVESFGDTVGLETFLLPAELCKDRQRQWQVISSEATALMISFNSVKPFLSERSLRSVKALWRAAAVEVVLPFLESVITPRASKSETMREHLTSIVMQGTPLIGPEDCARFDYSSQFHLCFYLRGSDASGMFNRHSPPCYISAFYANQLVWRDPEVVLYAVPMNISDSGYVPWNLRRRGPATGPASDGGEGSAAAVSMAAAASSRRRPSPHPPRAFHNDSHRGSTAPASEPTAAAGSTYADAEGLLNGILRGVVPTEMDQKSSRGNRRSLRSQSLRGGPYEGGDGLLGTAPDLSHVGSEVLLMSTVDGSRHRFPQHHSGEEHHDDEEEEEAGGPVCVLQNLASFVTPVPYVNLLFAHYAEKLELLCIAALRYICYPDDEFHVRHAQYTAEATLEFLLSFAVELTLLRRAVKIIARMGGKQETAKVVGVDGGSDGGASEMLLLGIDGRGDRGGEVDADFQCKVCAWSRQAAATGKHHLRTLILEMNTFANRRFRRYVAALQQAVRLQPRLASVESVEGMQKLLRTLEE